MAYSMICVCVCPYLLLDVAGGRVRFAPGQVICAKGDDVGSSSGIIREELPRARAPRLSDNQHQWK